MLTLVCAYIYDSMEESTGPNEINFSKILLKYINYHSRKRMSKMSCAKRRELCSNAIVKIYRTDTTISASVHPYPWLSHYIPVIMSTMASQTTGFKIVYSTVCLGADQRKHQSSASLVFVRGIHRWPGNFPHKGPAVTRKMVPFDDVILCVIETTS